MAFVAARHPYCPCCEAVFRSALPRCPADGTAIEVRAEDPLLGTALRGDYRLEALLGEGGTGRVYRATRTAGAEQVAVKILYGEYAAQPRRAARFAREAESASALRHANIVHLLDFGETARGLPFLVMEYVEGPSLAALIEREAPFAPDRIAQLLGDLCRALSYVHGRGLVHRDLKGGNVMVLAAGGGERERAKLFDFGIALERKPAIARRLTSGKSAVGTLTCMAPEQAIGPSVDHRADLFSLGVLTYQMLAGASPFSGSATLIALQNATAPVPPIAERVPGLEVDQLLESVARKLMEKRPQDRFQSANEVLEAIGWRWG